MTSFENMTLYYKPTCPYCRKVLDFMYENDIEVELISISDEPAREELMKLEGGRTQVPCLVIDGKPMLESDDIIEFLKSKIS